MFHVDRVLGARNVENLRHSGYEELKDHRAKHYVTGESPLSDCVLGHQLSLASLPAMVLGQNLVRQCSQYPAMQWVRKLGLERLVAFVFDRYYEARACVRGEA